MIALVLLGLVSAGSLHAQTNFVWTNLAATTLPHNWSQAGWTNTQAIGSAVPANGGSNDYALSFGITSSQGNATNNLGAFRLNRLFFLTQAMNLYGNDLIFVTNSSGGTPTVAFNHGANTRNSLIGNNLVLSNTTVLGGNGTAASSGSTLTLAGIVSGPGGLIKTNVSVLILTSNNTYTGGTTISNGTLQIGAGAASGWVQGDITSLGTVIFNRSDNVTFSNVLAGSGSLMKKGAGTLILTSNNTYSGGTVLSNGTLSVSSDANLGGANTAFTFAGGTLQVTGTSLTNFNARTVNWEAFNGGFDVAAAGNTFTVTNALTSIGLTKLGAGTLVLAGGASFTNAATVAAGQMVVLGGVFNQSSFSITNGAVVNVGGTTAAGAMASGVTFTNDSSASLRMGVTGAGSVGTLNASTSTIGVLNRGVISFFVGSTGYLNATLFNDVGGAVTGNTTTATAMYIERFPTNLGTVRFRQSARLTINQGDFYNVGLFNEDGGTHSYFDLPGTFVNASNGTVMTADYNNWNVQGFINYGTVIVSNTAASTPIWAITSGSGALVITNYGTFRLIRSNPNASYPMFTATNFLNVGLFVGSGNLDAISTNNVVLTVGIAGNGAGPFAFTNAPGGEVLATNGASLAFLSLANFGRITVATNSAVAIGKQNENVSTKLSIGLSPFLNDGLLNLRGGAFGASALTNAVTATFRGYGDLGLLSFTNVSSLGGATTFVRNVAARTIFNQGLLAPEGVFNAGAITNANGARIIGYGEIQSFHRTNYYSGETFIATNLNTGGAVANLAGATVLADGGTLALQNGFARNSQAGTVGTTNGGTLRLGDGTLALTNSGTVTLQGGTLQLGSLVNSGSLVGTGALQAASVTSSGTLAPGFSPGTMSFSNDLTLAGSSILNLEIAGTNFSDYDRLLVGGAFTQGGTLNVSFLSFTPTGGEVFDLFDFASLAGAFSLTNLPTLSGGLAWDFSDFDTQGSLAITMPIPEPGAAALLLLAAAGVLVSRRRVPRV